MKKTEKQTAEMKPEYDFTGRKGERGKYYQAYREGHTVQIHQPDGTVTRQYFGLEEGAIMLEPDVRAYFPDSESVNAALRSVIELMKHLPPNERYQQKTGPAHQAAEPHS
jgi:hypothetical protein